MADTTTTTPPATETPPPPRPPRLRWERFPIRRIILITLAVSIVLGVFFGTRATLQLGRFDAATWRSLIIAGVARGSVYALIALGYTLVYGILFLINFAHGEVFMAGAFTAFFAASALANAGIMENSPVLGVAVILAVAMVVSTIVAVVLERVAYRPLRGSPRLVPLITAIGASLFLQYTFRGLYGASVKAPPPIGGLTATGTPPWRILGIAVDRPSGVAILGAVVLMTVLYVFISRTRTGRSMRAVGEDKEIASLMGINVDRTIVTTFAIGGMLAGAAGILYTLLFKQVIFTMGFFPGIKAFTSAVLGGIGSITGAAVGGLMLGVLEAVGPILFLSGSGIQSPNQLQPVVAFGILVLVLIFRPGGIFGSPEEKRA
ncbi:MAG: branched-chain amino acid ABC transporter permease [Actinomycetota bacterium]|nr:branched-chain amino acid ABC transporter permease [Actinomycetota bacterium]